jgi:RNA polymerase sigma factor (sigma-70 family)
MTMNMDQQQRLAERFEEHRPRLRAVAYRMLGSLSEAEDAVQDAWLRLSRADTGAVKNLGGWLTTVVGRVALNMLRGRRTRREEPLAVRLPDPIVDPAGGTDPEHEAVLSDSVGMAMLVVLETLTPAERVAFVLHDMFSVPFEDIAPILERSPEATRQLASRARRRVRAAPAPDTDRGAQWKAVDAFLAASRNGDLQALVAVLDPDVVLRADRGPASRTGAVRGAREVAGRALLWSRVDLVTRRAIVNGAAGMIAMRDGEPFAVGAVTVRGGRIVELDILSDPERLRRLDLSRLGPEGGG